MKTKIMIVVGTGGVGKTTVASALALQNAIRGKKTLVITLDPAQRLADALSLKQKSKHIQKIDAQKMLGQELNPAPELFALLPDLKAEWDDFLRISIGQAHLRREIASNHFYRYMAEGLPGSLEIISAHLLFRLVKEEAFDLIVLDTPPASNSLAFFDVPQKVINVLEQNAFRAIARRQKNIIFTLSKKFAFFSSGILQSTFERLIGSHFLSELIDFALSIDALYEPMLERAHAMQNIFVDEATSYVLVLRPTKSGVNDAIELNLALSARHIKVQSLIMNQMLPDLDENLIEEELRAYKAVTSAHVGPEALRALDRAKKLYEKKYQIEQALYAKVHELSWVLQLQKLHLVLTEDERTRIMPMLVRELNQD